MTAYVTMVSDFARAYLGGNDNGQNMVETALLIGVISLVLVFAFITSNIEVGITNLANRAACDITGGNWAGGLGNAVGTCN